MAHENLRPLKITTVGDGAVGKTCMLIVYTGKHFPKDYIPTVFDNYTETITVDGDHYRVTLCDTAGQEDYERLRPLSYPSTNCFIVCYSISSRDSYQNVTEKWFPELRDFSPSIPIILVATKTDLREEPGADLVTTAEGMKLKKKIKASAFVECSAKAGESLSRVIEEAVRSAVREPPAAGCSCAIL